MSSGQGYQYAPYRPQQQQYQQQQQQPPLSPQQVQYQPYQHLHQHQHQQFAPQQHVPTHPVQQTFLAELEAPEVPVSTKPTTPYPQDDGPDGMPAAPPPLSSAEKATRPEPSPGATDTQPIQANPWGFWLPSNEDLAPSQSAEEDKKDGGEQSGPPGGQGDIPEELQVKPLRIVKTGANRQSQDLAPVGPGQHHVEPETGPDEQAHNNVQVPLPLQPGRRPETEATSPVGPAKLPSPVQYVAYRPPGATSPGALSPTSPHSVQNFSTGRLSPSPSIHVPTVPPGPVILPYRPASADPPPGAMPPHGSRPPPVPSPSPGSPNPHIQHPIPSPGPHSPSVMVPPVPQPTLYAPAAVPQPPPSPGVPIPQPQYASTPSSPHPPYPPPSTTPLSAAPMPPSPYFMPQPTYAPVASPVAGSSAQQPLGSPGPSIPSSSTRPSPVPAAAQQIPPPPASASLAPSAPPAPSSKASIAVQDTPVLEEPPPSYEQATAQEGPSTAVSPSQQAPQQLPPPPPPPQEQHRPPTAPSGASFAVSPISPAPTGHGMPNVARPSPVPPPLPPRNPTQPTPSTYQPPPSSSSFSAPPGGSHSKPDSKIFGSSTAKKWLDKTNEVIDQNVHSSRRWWDQTSQVIDHTVNPYLADPRYNPWARPPPAFGMQHQQQNRGFGPPVPGQPMPPHGMYGYPTQPTYLPPSQGPPPPGSYGPYGPQGPPRPQ